MTIATNSNFLKPFGSNFNYVYRVRVTYNFWSNHWVSEGIMSSQDSRFSIFNNVVEQTAIVMKNRGKYTTKSYAYRNYEYIVPPRESNIFYHGKRFSLGNGQKCIKELTEEMNVVSQYLPNSYS